LNATGDDGKWRAFGLARCNHQPKLADARGVKRRGARHAATAHVQHTGFG
jgi:hypothetical protein